MYGCLIVILFLGLFLVLAVVSSILNFFFGLWRTTQRLKKGANSTNQNARQEQGGWYSSSSTSNYSNTSSTSSSTNNTTAGGKIFDKNEGEYVDFEEVKNE